MTPDLKNYTFAVSDYFTRDLREKNAASIAMIMSQLDQEDIWAFSQRLILELAKYEDMGADKKILEELYFGNSRIPSIDDDHIPLYYLKADALTDTGNVRIRGLSINDSVEEILPWTSWQQLKKESALKILSFSAKVISKIDKVNNFSEPLLQIVKKSEEIRIKTEKQFNVAVSTLVTTSYYDSSLERNFSNNRKDFVTFRRDSPDSDKSKFKIYSRDYFYNLQILISQVFNSTDFSESMFHLGRVITYIANILESKTKKGNIFRVELEPNLDRNFLKLVSKYQTLNSILVTHQYLTTDERIASYHELHEVKATLNFCQGKILSLVNYILTVAPYTKTNTFFQEAEW